MSNTPLKKLCFKTLQAKPRSSFSTEVDTIINKVASKYDASQTSQLHDTMILVDEQDKVLGQITKVQGHLNSYLQRTHAKPHRAFSLFVFNTQNQLLMQ